MQHTNYDAIVQNARFFKHILGQTKLCAVLKNDAYGHGIVRVASALSGIADFFAVGSLREALAAEPFCKHILILLPLWQKWEIQTAVLHGFSLTVDSLFTLKATKTAVDELNICAKIHIKIETGMNRLGFTFKQLPQVVNELNAEKCRKIFQIEGIFSHFWGQTQETCDEQTQKFVAAQDFIVSKISSDCKPLAHIANTSATLLGRKYFFDMVRVGLGLYGYGDARLKIAKTVSAQVVAVRDVSEGQTVGYGATHTFAKNTRIAILNAGYANGFSRALAPARVKIGSEIFSTVGNICMAMCAADIGGAAVNVGDEAILLGEGINNANSEVIVYELLCNLK